MHGTEEAAAFLRGVKMKREADLDYVDALLDILRTPGRKDLAGTNLLSRSHTIQAVELLRKTIGEIP